MKCSLCKKETHAIWINKKYQKLCYPCMNKKRKEKQKKNL